MGEPLYLTLLAPYQLLSYSALLAAYALHIVRRENMETLSLRVLTKGHRPRLRSEFIFAEPYDADDPIVNASQREGL